MWRSSTSNLSFALTQIFYPVHYSSSESETEIEKIRLEEDEEGKFRTEEGGTTRARLATGHEKTNAIKFRRNVEGE